MNGSVSRWSVAVLTCGVLSCTSPPVEPSRASIGASGGEVHLDGVTLRIPPGALADPVTVSISNATASSLPDGVTAASSTYQFSPDGLRFLLPATVTFTMNGQPNAPAVYWSSASGDGLESISGTVTGATISALVSHFSHGLVGDSNACGKTLKTDAENCGRCGNHCSGAAHTESTCHDGQCASGDCETGYADCDHDPSNGCEANLLGGSNCGRCGNVCDTSAACTATSSGASCQCTVGDGGSCSSLDACSTNNGGCGDAAYFACTNHPGATPSCADIDECATNNGGCGTATYFSCTNNIGAAPTCADINECATSNGGCGNATYFTCTNNVGAAPTCADINECLINNGGCGNATYFSCTNNVGAAPTCADVNECATNNGGCGALSCQNNLGGPPTCFSPDAGPGDAGQPDGGPRGASCPAVTTPDAAVFTTFSSDPGFACLFGGPPEVTNWSSMHVALTDTTQVTMWDGHSLSGSVRAVGIADDCRAPNPTCLSSVSYPSVLSLALDAGVYEFEARGFGQHIVFEGLPPVANNVNCAGASALGYQPRVVDGQPRVYTYTASSSRTVNVVFWGTMQVGALNVDVRTTCDDSSTSVASGSVPYIIGSMSSPTTAASFTATSGQTYFIFVSGITNGIDYTIGVQ